MNALLTALGVFALIMVGVFAGTALRKALPDEHLSQESKDVIRLGVSVANEIGDPIGDDARLARAGAGEDQERSITMEHGLALFGIQFGKEVHVGGNSV